MTAQQTQNSKDNQASADNHQDLPPAVTLPLTGRHLIEASAGTGKTWTLTGVVLRLIVEGGNACEKIIATTFTRSAAAEMRQRIRERLQDFYNLLKIINHEKFTELADNELHDEKDIALQKYENFLKQVRDYAEQKNQLKQYEDPINLHLIEWIAKQVFEVPLAEKDDSTKQQAKPTQTKVNFRIALQRTSLALNQLDRLFVSTIDSLCQKWLREYSSETGFSTDVQISNDVSAIIKGMIHDQLRAFMAQVNEHMPELYPLMLDKKVFKSVDDYYCAVDRALNFYTAEIDTIELTKFDTTAILANMQAIAEYQDAEFKTFFDKGVRKKKGFNGRNQLAKNFDEIKNLQNFLKEPSIAKSLQVAKVAKIDKLFEAFNSLFINGEGFDDRDNDREYFKSFEIVKNIWRLIQQIQQFEDYFNQVNYYFIQFISRYVRTHLPQMLESQRLTTFSLQLAILNDALAGTQGQSLARYIRHQYPIALIDESQDVNTEQALLIQRVYLDDLEQSKQKNEDKSAKPNNQFLLLVGDPKQAIYGFRGGDVENYTTLKKLFPEEPKTLTNNHRSPKALIESLNYWYGVGEQDIDPKQAMVMPDVNAQPYYMGNEIFYRRIKATREEGQLTLVDDASHILDEKNQNAQILSAFNHISIDYKTPYITENGNELDTEPNEEKYVDAADAIVAQILRLFDDNLALNYKDQPLSLNDICILAIKNNDLDIIHTALQKHGIATVRGGSQSVFGDVMSADLLTLMSVLLAPFNEAKLKALLLSSFFQLTLEDINLLYQQNESANPASNSNQNTSESKVNSTLADIQQLVFCASEMWQKHSFLVALQWLLNEKIQLPQQLKMNFWQRLAKHEQGERLLIDFRQLMDIISEQFNGQVGEHQLYEWFYAQVQEQPKEDWSTQQRLPSEVGVQLMTVHASKGLEFPIVFVVGFTQESKAKFRGAPFYLYDSQHVLSETTNSKNPLLKRRLTALPKSIEDGTETDYIAIENDYTYEEQLRLLYVSLTRAQEQVYLVTIGKYKETKNTPLTPFMSDLKQFKVKEDLISSLAVNEIDINSLSKYINPSLYFSINEKEKTEVNIIEYEKFENIITTKEFKGWANTSFTALSRYIEATATDTAINAEYRQDDEIAIANHSELIDLDEQLNADLESQSIRFSFEKGANPGTFLHSILEDIANNYSESKDDVGDGNSENTRNERLKRWSVMIDRTLRRYQMPANYFSTQASSVGEYGDWRELEIRDLQSDYIKLVDWLDDIIHTPLMASSTRLFDISYKHKIAELGFNLRLSQHLSFSDLNALFKDYNIPLQLQNQEINTMVWQYLKGEIDLVYQHGEKFYIVDYKSNYLGNNFTDYNQKVLEEAMTSHSYWLQASIYQVALHRYLKLRLPNYEIQHHLGAVEYAFLRGMTPLKRNTGRLVKKFDTYFILALDELFGYPHPSNNY